MVTAVPPSVPSAVPSSVNTVPVLTEPQLSVRQYYTSPQPGNTGRVTSRVPYVPATETEGNGETPAQPGMARAGSVRGTRISGNPGAPSVPLDGFLWQPGTIDPHYLSEYQDINPYTRVNNPPTRGMFTWVKDFLNHIATSQDVDNAGWKVRHAQQRTSWMRITPPAHGIGYISGEQFTPRQMPQQPNTYKVIKSTGTLPYGSGVLNNDTFGAGQTAGGIGGNQYAPQPGPPPTTSVTASNPSGMPTWG